MNNTARGFLFFILFACGGCRDSAPSEKEADPVPAAAAPQDKIQTVYKNVETLEFNGRLAEASRYAPDAWQEAEKLFAQAKRAIQDGDARQARYSLYKAKLKFQQVLEKAGKSKAIFDECAAVKKEAEALLAKLEKMQGKTLAPQWIEKFHAQREKAEAFFRADAGKALLLFRAARQAALNGMKAVEAVISQDLDLDRLKHRVMALRERFAAELKKAESTKLDEFEPDVFKHIVKFTRDADAAFSDSAFEQAEMLYMQAKALLADLSAERREAGPMDMADAAQTEDAKPPREPEPPDTLVSDQDLQAAIAVVQTLLKARNACDLEAALACTAGSAARNIGSNFAHSFTVGIWTKPQIQVTKTEKNGDFIFLTFMTTMRKENRKRILPMLAILARIEDRWRITYMDADIDKPKPEAYEDISLPSLAYAQTSFDMAKARFESLLDRRKSPIKTKVIKKRGAKDGDPDTKIRPGL